ncbi:MAG: ACP S-malonyltransferase [Arenicellales bacterium]|nr:ACP S-malonyltransferase [Arenicellales bacterium]
MSESKAIYIFPGQGSQYKGIGSDLYDLFDTAKKVYEEASDILCYDIAKLSFENPDGQINLTRYTQPVLLTHHVACLRVYQELAAEPLPAYAAAGHSLGEYSALVLAEALSFGSALDLVRVRGELMGEYGEGEMSALPVDIDAAKEWSDSHYCAIAGINLSTQTVVAGAAADLDVLEAEFLKDNPRKRPVRLKTEGAFHTYYMVEAARRFRDSLDAVEIEQPKIKILSNYAGTYHQPDPAKIKANLFFQLFHPVNWTACLHTAMADGVDTFIEFGGGIGKGETPAEMRPNLESMIKKTARSLEKEIQYFPAINVETIKKVASN